MTTPPDGMLSAEERATIMTEVVPYTRGIVHERLLDLLDHASAMDEAMKRERAIGMRLASALSGITDKPGKLNSNEKSWAAALLAEYTALRAREKT